MEPPVIPTLHCVDDTDHTDLDKDPECRDSEPWTPDTAGDVTTRVRNCLLIAFNIDFLFTTLSSDYRQTRVTIDFLVVDLTPSTLIINISTIASVGSLCVYFPSSAFIANCDKNRKHQCNKGVCRNRNQFIV